MKPFALIARFTIQEILHEKVLWSFFIFGFLCLGISFAVAQLSFNDSPRMVLNFGLSAIFILTGFIAIFLSANLISREVEHRTLYLILSRPVPRTLYVLGRYAGLCGVLFLISASMGVLALIVYLMWGGGLNAMIFGAYAFIGIEFCIIAAFGVMLSCITSPVLNAVSTAGVWIIGHAMDDLNVLSEKIEPLFLRKILRVFVSVFPDLTRFDLKLPLFHSTGWEFSVLPFIYALFYIGFCLCLAIFLFSRKDF